MRTKISSILIFLLLSTFLVGLVSAAVPTELYTTNTTFISPNYISSDFWWFILLVSLFFFIVSNLIERNNDVMAAISIPFAWLAAYWSTAINYIDNFVNVIGNSTEYYTIVYTHQNNIYTPLYLTIVLYTFAVLATINLAKIVLEHQLPSRSKEAGDDIEKPDFMSGEDEMEHGG
jgi:hypothetical protein